MTGDYDYTSELVGANDIDRTLCAIERTVDGLITEPLNTAEIFGDTRLDIACQTLGKVTLDQLDVPISQHPSDVPVFIASRLQRSGGHTALLIDIARHAAKGAVIFITGVGGSTRIKKLMHLFRGIEPLHFEQAPRGNRKKKLIWLQRRLREQNPETVWLFNHHADSVAVAAVQPNQGYALKYCHHGDHHLCLGATLAFGEHYDPHPMGFYNCRNELGRLDNKYLPMAVPKPERRSDIEKWSKVDTPFVTCTAAGSNKIDYAYWPSYPEVVAKILAATGGSHVHIGRLSWIYRWRMKRALSRHGIDSRKLQYIPYVPSVSRSLHDSGVDLYISSFPYAGARTLVEVMSTGIPTAAHDHNGSRFLSAMDMLPPGSFVWSHPNELIEFLRRNTREDLQVMGRQALMHYDNYHTPEVMRTALHNDEHMIEIMPSQFSHRPDLLAQAIRRQREVSIKGVLNRAVRRWVRRLRSNIS